MGKPLLHLQSNRKSASFSEGKNLRTVIIGYGVAGSAFHAPLITATPGLALTAVVTKDESRKAQLKETHSHIRILQTADEVWQNPDQYDLAVIATPNRYHAPLAKAFMQAGIPVVIDKPMATSVAECESLIAASKKTGTLLTVFHNRRWDSDFLTVAKLIETGKLGSVVRMESRFDRYRPQPKEGTWRELATPEDGGGLLFDLGSHLIDQAITLFGYPQEVYAEIDTRRDKAMVDDDTFVALKFASGVRVHLWMSVLARRRGPRFRVMGMHGTYEKWGVDVQEEALRAGLSPNSANWGVEPASMWGDISTDLDGVTFEGKIETIAGNYTSFYAQLYDAIINGGAPPVLPEEALETMLVTEAAKESAASGRVVKLAARFAGKHA